MITRKTKDIYMYCNDINENGKPVNSLFDQNNRHEKTLVKCSKRRDSTKYGANIWKIHELHYAWKIIFKRNQTKESGSTRINCRKYKIWFTIPFRHYYRRSGISREAFNSFSCHFLCKISYKSIKVFYFWNQFKAEQNVGDINRPLC